MHDMNKILAICTQDVISPNSSSSKYMLNDSYMLDIALPEALPVIKPKAVKLYEIFSINYLNRRSLIMLSKLQS